MTRHSFAKLLVASAGAALALGAASVAHARSDVHFSIGINAPLGYVQPAPIYYQPQPVYVQPAPVYVQPQPIYYYGHQPRHVRHGGWRDADRDGVPNRYDRAPRNPYRY